MGCRPAARPSRRRRTTTSERHITDLVEQPAKVMRIGSMIRQLLEEVKAAPLDEASRNRLRRSTGPRSRSSRPGSRPSWSRSSSGCRCRSPTRHPVRGRAADRAGPAGRLARGAVPRHPDRDLRPADGRPRPARADAPGAAAGHDADEAAQPGRPAAAPPARSRAAAAACTSSDRPPPYQPEPPLTPMSESATGGRPRGHLSTPMSGRRVRRRTRAGRSRRRSRSSAVRPPSECVDSVKVSVV